MTMVTSHYNSNIWQIFFTKILLKEFLDKHINRINIYFNYIKPNLMLVYFTFQKLGFEFPAIIYSCKFQSQHTKFSIFIIFVKNIFFPSCKIRFSLTSTTTAHYYKDLCSCSKTTTLNNLVTFFTNWLNKILK
jgi:hypothetical protein